MTLIDIISIAFAVLTIVVVFRSGQQIKTLLADARYERLEINRRLEKMRRRIDELDEATIDTEED